MIVAFILTQPLRACGTVLSVLVAMGLWVYCRKKTPEAPPTPAEIQDPTSFKDKVFLERPSSKVVEVFKKGPMKLITTLPDGRVIEEMLEPVEEERSLNTNECLIPSSLTLSVSELVPSRCAVGYRPKGSNEAPKLIGKFFRYGMKGLMPAHELATVREVVGQDVDFFFATKCRQMAIGVNTYDWMTDQVLDFDDAIYYREDKTIGKTGPIKCSSEPRSDDMCVVKLFPDGGSRLGLKTLAKPDTSTEQPVQVKTMVYGPSGVSVSSGKVVDWRPELGLFTHTCSTDRGSSGSLVYSGTAAIGVHLGASSDGQKNIGMTMDAAMFHYRCFENYSYFNLRNLVRLIESDAPTSSTKPGYLRYTGGSYNEEDIDRGVKEALKYGISTDDTRDDKVFDIERDTRNVIMKWADVAGKGGVEQHFTSDETKAAPLAKLPKRMQGERTNESAGEVRSATPPGLPHPTETSDAQSKTPKLKNRPISRPPVSMRALPRSFDDAVGDAISALKANNAFKFGDAVGAVENMSAEEFVAKVRACRHFAELLNYAEWTDAVDDRKTDKGEIISLEKSELYEAIKTVEKGFRPPWAGKFPMKPKASCPIEGMDKAQIEKLGYPADLVHPASGPKAMIDSLEWSLENRPQGVAPPWDEEIIRGMVDEGPKESYNDFYEAIRRAWDMQDMSTSPQWSKVGLGLDTKTKMKEQAGELIAEIVAQRLVALALSTRVGSLTTWQAVRCGCVDPRVPFTKNELHTATKAEAKRWRLIWGVSLIDSLTERVLNDPHNKAIVEAYPRKDPRLNDDHIGVGLGHHDGGHGIMCEWLTRAMDVAPPAWQFCSADLSNFDCTVNDKDLEALGQMRARQHELSGKDFGKMCSPMTIGFYANAAGNHCMLMGSEVRVLHPRQICASGRDSTSSDQSKTQAMINRAACMRSGRYPYRVLGDDLAALMGESQRESYKEAAEEHLKIVKFFLSSEDRMDFTSHGYHYDAATGKWKVTYDNVKKMVSSICCSGPPTEEQQSAYLNVIRNNPKDDEIKVRIAMNYAMLKAQMPKDGQPEPRNPTCEWVDAPEENMCKVCEPDP